MRFLRTASTRRLLAALGAVVAVIIAGAALAVASGTGGPVAKPQSSLAVALHNAAAAPAPQSVSANITFANHLIDTTNIQGTDPILTGAHGYLWATQNRLRVELFSTSGGMDAQVVVNNRSWWLYDPAMNTVYEGTLPADTGKQPKSHAGTIPTVAQIQSQLNQVMAHVGLSGPVAGDTGGQPSYTVTVTPKHSGGLLGDVQLAWDATHGIPLRFALYASHNGQTDSTPTLELTASNVTFNNVRPSDLAARRPTGATVVKVAAPAGPPAGAKPKAKGKTHKDLTGVSAVAKHLSFRFNPPQSLAGKTRQSVELLDWGGRPAALVTYGQGLGGIAVIERAETPGKASKTPGTSSGGDHRNGLTLPSVTLSNKASATELDTAIGTVVQFTRGGVSYTVLGSVPKGAAEAAAGAL